jgi:hypothetical protein
LYHLGASPQSIMYKTILITIVERSTIIIITVAD